MNLDDDLFKTGEQRMADGLRSGCLLVLLAVSVVVFLVATLVKVWL